jgi:hypothetical protein
MAASKSWSKHERAGGLGITPAMDSLAIVILCWALAPVDLFFTWKRLYTEAKDSLKKRNP